MQKPELIGVIVSVEPNMRIQLLDDKDGNKFIVRDLCTDGNVEQGVKPFSYKEPGTKDSALVAALDEFMGRIRNEREGLKSFVPIEEFALVLNSTGEPQEIGDYNVYTAKRDTPEESIAAAEDAAIAAGMYDIDELRGNPDYSASIAALLKTAQETEHTGIALLIR